MFKITRARTITALVIFGLLGAVITFHATNLVLASILNSACPIWEFIVTLFPSLTFLIVSFDFILFLFFFMRLYIHPTHEQRMLHVYGVTLVWFSAFGLLLNTLSAAITYGSLIVAHPFPGFHIVMYFYNLITLGVGLAMIFYFPHRVINDDIIIHRTSVKYIFETILSALIVFIALNRLGAFILSPSFIQWSSLGLTYPAYVSLLFPTIIIMIDLAYVFGGFKDLPISGIVLCSFTMFLSIFFCAQTLYRGWDNQLFIQLCSPINPIGRLLTIPIDDILQAVVAAGLSLYTLINSISFKRASDFNKLPYEIRMAKQEGREANFLTAKKGRKRK